ncbi:MAG: alpha/beta fold hydrolase [Paracoccaceae bacterium]|nr:MAG: alpha/beta fold hydrolase [Paracoccaceae bacterium]
MSIEQPIHSATPVVDTVRITADGALLTGHLYRPAGRPRAAVVIHGATAVPMGFYRAFAEWLAAERSLAVLTYDYRGFGASARGPMARSSATMADWGLRDQAAALSAVRRLVPGVPAWVIGHSLGGLMLGYHPAMEGVERTILVGAGLVSLADHPPAFRAKAWAFWHLMPPLVRAMGHLPGWAGLGTPIPKGVYADWRRWCLAGGFHLSDVGTRLPLPDPAAVGGTMRVVAVEDDAWAPPAAVWRAMALYPRAMKRQVVLRGRDFGLQQIGHLGVFARRNAAVWPRLID